MTKDIPEYWPADTDSVKYEQLYEPTIQDIIDVAKRHFGNDVDMSFVSISVKKIHTHCLTYDLYDPSDWTTFHVFELDRLSALEGR